VLVRGGRFCFFLHWIRIGFELLRDTVLVWLRWLLIPKCKCLLRSLCSEIVCEASVIINVGNLSRL